MMKDIVIIGGGWSVRHVDLKAIGSSCKIIAVNDSAIYAPRWDLAISMDRLWTEARLQSVLLKSMEDSPHRRILLRRSAVQNIKHVENWPWVHVFDCDNESSVFSIDPGVLNGSNSGACALNLAYQLKPARIYLLGFDMNRNARGDPYWYPPYPWANPGGATGDGRYSDWAEQFTAARHLFQVAGVEVFNVSPASAITAFRKITPDQFARQTA